MSAQMVSETCRKLALRSLVAASRDLLSTTPAFVFQQIKELYPTFWPESRELMEALAWVNNYAPAVDKPTECSKETQRVIGVNGWTSAWFRFGLQDSFGNGYEGLGSECKLHGYEVEPVYYISAGDCICKAPTYSNVKQG